ncbi:MAG: hypothetical protein ABUT20_65070 [Bacteroidota bacterium]
MERVKALINTLQQQAQQNAGPAALLATIQQIQLELTGGVASSSRQLGTAKVAVVMPNHSRFMPPVQETAAVITQELKPVLQEASAVRESRVVFDEEVPVQKKNEESGWLFDPMKEIPTLAQQVNGKELNDIIGETRTSLNERLKTGKTELAEVLTESPIKDLKKGIGINDRYVFVNELFRGDDAMYERSIKTINGFRIMAEAEYWMERELKVKLGWDDGKATTQHFYQLVKRRFS